MKPPFDNVDFNFIENSLQMLGVRFRHCDVCGKRLLTQVAKIDRLCQDCFESQQELSKHFKKE